MSKSIHELDVGTFHDVVTVSVQYWHNIRIGSVPITAEFIFTFHKHQCSPGRRFLKVVLLRRLIDRLADRNDFAAFIRTRFSFNVMPKYLRGLSSQDHFSSYLSVSRLLFVLLFVFLLL